MSMRPASASFGLSTGKKARLNRVLYQHGLRNGTALFLPYDQGLEHGPRDFFANPAASEPKHHQTWPSRAASTASPSRSGWRRSSTGTMRARFRWCSS